MSIGGPIWWDTDDHPIFNTFWMRCQKKQLVARRCLACRSWASYLAHRCPACGNPQLEWAEVTGTGAIYSFTHVAHAARPELVQAVPYTLIIVDLSEGPRLMSRLQPAAPDETDLVGRRVAVDFREVDGGGCVPVFMLTDLDGVAS